MLESGFETHFKALQSARPCDTPSATLSPRGGHARAACSGDGQLTAPLTVWSLLTRCARRPFFLSLSLNLPPCNVYSWVLTSALRITPHKIKLQILLLSTDDLELYLNLAIWWTGEDINLQEGSSITSERTDQSNIFGKPFAIVSESWHPWFPKIQQYHVPTCVLERNSCPHT